MDARAAILAWEEEQKAAEEAPDSSVLGNQELVFAETLVRLFRGRIKIDAARKMISSGRLGPVVQVGKFKAVLKVTMYAHLLSKAEHASSKEAKQAVAALLALIPSRTPKSARPRGRSPARGGDSSQELPQIPPPPIAPRPEASGT
jgi:hypothetical protein